MRIRPGAGALLGGLASKGDAGYDDDSLKTLGIALQPGTSAIAIITSSLFLKAVREYGDDELMGEAVQNLADGNNVALGVLVTEAGVAVKQVTANEDAAHVVAAVSTEEGWAAAEALVMDEGVAARQVVGTDDADAGKGVVATDKAPLRVLLLLPMKVQQVKSPQRIPMMSKRRAKTNNNSDLAAVPERR